MEFNDNDGLSGIAKNTITAFNTSNQEYCRVTRKEFQKNDFLVGVTKGRSSTKKDFVYVTDTLDSNKKWITKKEYGSNKTRYIHSSKNKINCIDINTGESFCVSRDVFETTESLVGIRRKIVCPQCGLKGIGKKFRKQHFIHCKEKKNEN